MLVIGVVATYILWLTTKRSVCIDVGVLLTLMAMILSLVVGTLRWRTRKILKTTETSRRRRIQRRLWVSMALCLAYLPLSGGMTLAVVAFGAPTTVTLRNESADPARDVVLRWAYSSETFAEIPAGQSYLVNMWVSPVHSGNLRISYDYGGVAQEWFVDLLGRKVTLDSLTLFVDSLGRLGCDQPGVTVMSRSDLHR